MTNAKPCPMPIAASLPLSKHGSSSISNGDEFRHIVGSFYYLTITRPDIAFSVNNLCQFMHSPTEDHWHALKRLLQYLKGTVSHGLLLSHDSDDQLQCFSDSDWGACPDDRRSSNGYGIYFGKSFISWMSKKQSTITHSSTESEYKAIANATAKLLWLRSLLSKLGAFHCPRVVMWCDNIGAIYLSANLVFHARTKHTELDFHFVREQVQVGFLQLKFLTSHDQLADIYTKPMGKERFLLLHQHMSLLYLPMDLQGVLKDNS